MVQPANAGQLSKPAPARLAIIAGTAILALLLAMQALSAVRSVPTAVAAKVPMASGLTLGRLAAETVSIDATNPVAPKYTLRDPAAEEIAIAALARDPLTNDALFTLAAKRFVEGEQAEGLALIDLSDRVSRRHDATQFALLNQAAASGDIAAAAERMNVILTISPQFGDIFARQLAGQLANSAALDEVTALMRDLPMLARDVISFAQKRPELAANAARIRINLADVEGVSNTRVDAGLLERLAENGDLAEGLALYRTLRPDTAGRANLLASSDLFPPFDWATTRSISGSAQLSRDGSELEVRVKRGRLFEAASQRLPLPAGIYRFSATMAGDENGNAALAFYCPAISEGPDREMARIALRPGKLEERIALARGCDFARVSVIADAGRQLGDVRFSLRDIVLIPGQ